MMFLTWSWWSHFTLLHRKKQIERKQMWQIPVVVNWICTTSIVYVNKYRINCVTQSKKNVRGNGNLHNSSVRQGQNGSHWRCDGSMVGNVLVWPVLTFSSIFLYDWNENCWFDALFLLMGYGVFGAYLTVKELDTMKFLTHKIYPQIFFLWWSTFNMWRWCA